jgi:electron transfer flavoprotein beta subunit
MFSSLQAMGCDRGIHILTEDRTDSVIQPLAVAKSIKFLAEREKADLILIGKQSIDGDNCQTGQMLSALLGWAQCTFATTVEIDADKTQAKVERETDTGTETLQIKLPAVITTDLRLNEPRYATLPNIMKAKKKPIEVLGTADTGVDMSPQNTVLSVEDPPVRKGGVTVEGVDALIGKLKEAGVI